MFTAVLLLLTASPAGPFEDLKRALKAPATEANVDVRQREIGRCVDALHTLPDLRDALFLYEWPDASEPQGKLDAKQRERVAERFVGDTRRNLKSGSTPDRLATLELLASSGAWLAGPAASLGVGRAITPDVIELTRDSSDAVVRRVAARTLGEIFPEPGPAVSALESVLGSAAPEDRRAAAAALVRMVANATQRRPGRGPWPAAPADRKDVVATAVAVVGPARRGFGDEDAIVRRASVEVFREIPLALVHEVSVLPGTERWQPNGQESEAAERAARTKAVTETRPVVEALAAAVPQLAPLLGDADRDARLAANAALEANAEAKLKLHSDGDAAATEKPSDRLLGEALATTVPALVKELADKDVRIRLAALYVLETMESDAAAATGPLAEALKDNDSFVRWGAARALGRMAPAGGEKAVTGLVTVADDLNGDVRATALAALARYGALSKPAVPVLATVLAGKRDVETRVLAARALGAIGAVGGPPAAEALAAALIASEPDLRRAAAVALRDLGPANRPAQSALLRALSDSDADVRKSAADALLTAR